MNTIVLTDDDLKVLEKQFGTIVRQMGTWNSDGTFGYVSIQVAAVEKVAEDSNDPNLIEAIARLQSAPARTRSFIELLEVFGSFFIERVVAAYRERSRELRSESRPASQSAKQETRTILVAGA